MNSTIKNTLERTRQYWYVDGFNEMLIGMVFLLLAGINHISGILDPSPFSAILVGVGYPVIILLSITLGGKLVNKLKSRYTYPRTGFVKYIRPEPSERRKRAVKTGVVSAVISIFILMVLSGLNPMVYIFSTGAFLTLLFVVFAARIPLPRFYLMALWSMVVIVLAYFSGFSFVEKMVLLLAGNGIGLLVSGFLVLVTYLNNTSPADADLGGD
jgi:hypothetical protein